MNRAMGGVLALAALACAGCREDMQIQPKYTSLEISRFYPDGRAARPVPPGTIAVDEAVQDPAVTAGMVKGEFLTTIPVPVTQQLLERGEQRFNIYCAPCHARTGDGNGRIAHRGFKFPADLNGERVRNAPPGYLYQVIVNGFGAMASYGYQVRTPRDRWAIVAYIRALELSRKASLADVPPEERAKLEAGK